MTIYNPTHALQFWLNYPFQRRRPCHFYAISKDHKKGDHRGRPASVHYWELSAELILAVVQWELLHNNIFEVLSSDGNAKVQLLQTHGLPIGGILSATLVELVATFRELTQPWPSLLEGQITARYRDNFYLALVPASSFDWQALAHQLS